MLAKVRLSSTFSWRPPLYSVSEKIFFQRGFIYWLIKKKASERRASEDAAPLSPSAWRYENRRYHKASCHESNIARSSASSGTYSCLVTRCWAPALLRAFWRGHRTSTSPRLAWRWSASIPRTPTRRDANACCEGSIEESNWPKTSVSHSVCRGYYTSDPL